MLRTFLLVTCWVIIAITRGQTSGTGIAGFFNKQTEEKIYIHFNKNSYAPGETIWFKAYIRGADSPFSVSNNFYIMLSDPEGRVLAYKKYPVLASSAGGDISLPAYIKAGQYSLTAVTGSMLSGPAVSIYQKNIIISGSNNDKEKLLQKDRGLQMVFYPEAGKLIAGIPAVVGFKATDENGLPLDIKGNLTTADGLIVLSFTSSHDGVGSMEFRPRADKNYFAEVETSRGVKKFPLPGVLSSGVSLNIRDEKSGKKILFGRSRANDKTLDSLLLVAAIDGRIISENEILWDGYASAVTHLATDNLPSGILQVILFSKERVPLAGRISFIDNGEYRSVPSCKLEEKNGEITADFIFPDSLTRNCSVLITANNPDPEPNDENIWSGLLLGNRFTEPVYNPAFYFQQEDKGGDTSTHIKQRATDNLMLVSQIRPQQTNDLANIAPAGKINDPFLINISGRVLSKPDQKPVKGGNLLLYFSGADSGLLCYTIPVSEKGKFVADSLNLVGRGKAYYSYKDKNGTELPVTAVLDSDTTLKYIIRVLSAHNRSVKSPVTDEILVQQESGNPDAKQLDSVVVRASSKRPLDILNEKYTSEIFRTGGKIKIDNINSPPVDGSMNGIDFVLNRITNLGVQYGTFVNRRNFSLQDNKERNIRAQGPKTTVAGSMRFWEVGLFINEIPADITQLQSLRADQIAMVKFFESGAVGSGSQFPGGALAVYLKYENVIPPEKRNSGYFEYQGYSAAARFTVPATAAIAAQASQDTGDMPTILWNPALFCSADSNTLRVIFTKPPPGKKIKIVLEGIDGLGRLIHFDKVIQSESLF